MIVTFSTEICSSTQPHLHQVHEFILGTEGTAWLCTKSERLPISEQSSILVPAGISHHYEVADEATEARVTYVCFDDEAVKQVVSANLAERLRGLLSGGVSYTQANNADASESRVLAGILRAALRTSGPFTDEKAGNTLSTLLVNHSSSLVVRGELGHSKQKNTIANILGWLKDNLDHDISIDNAAQKAHMSRSVFTRNFKQHTGMSFTHYLTDTRLTLAAKLLALDSSSIEDIAIRCGYRNLGHFYAQFQARYKITPGDYRRVSREMISPKPQTALER